MTKRERSQSPEAPNKRHVSAPLPSSSKSSVPLASHSSKAWLMPGNLQIRSIPGTPSPDTNSVLKASTALHSPQLAHEGLMRAEKSQDSPPAVASCADIKATGPAIPSTAATSVQRGTVKSPSPDKGFQYPAPSLTHYTSTESFPSFLTGNVIIECNLITPSKTWQLHSAILERHSSWFRHAMHIAPQNRECFHTWSFSLEEQDGEIALVLRSGRPILPKSQNETLDIKEEVTPDGQVATMTTPSVSTDTSTPEAEPAHTFKDDDPHAAIVDIYDQIFGSFYSIPLRLPLDTITTTLTTSESLLKISQTLNNTPLISAHISSALHHHRHSLYTSISTDPARYLLLSLTIQNDAIYTESLIHIIGAHPCWPWVTRRLSLPGYILTLIERKSHALNTTYLATERALLLLTIHIHKSSPVQAQNTTQFDTWFIVQTFRDQFACAFHALEKDQKGVLKRGALMRKIWKGGEEYMALGEMRRLMARVMPSAVENLEEDLGLLKGCAREIVEEVAGNELLLDVEGGGVGYLTCVKIEKEDIPWRAGDEGES